MDQFKFKSLTEETSEEITRKIWDLSTSKNIKTIESFKNDKQLLKFRKST